MSLHSDIVVAGAGIAGLTAALALAHHKMPVTIVEAFARPTEIGAGIQVPPNACHVLAQLGVLTDVKTRATKPSAIRLGDAPSGSILLSMPVNEKHTPYTPFLTIHRAALHQTLYRAALAHPDIDIITGHRIARVQTSPKAVTLTAETSDGTAQLSARVLIGADGVWSRCRRAIKGAAEAKPTGRIALRAVVPAHANAAEDPTITAWMAERAHLVCYPVRNKDTQNIVAIADGTAAKHIWDSQADHKTLALLADQFTPCGYRKVIKNSQWTVWPLAQVTPDAPWHDDGHIVLIGDAAHATEPFAAQGAAMAIEDAFVLARCMAEHAADTRAAFNTYRSQRHARVAKMAKRTAFNRRVYHMGGLSRLARNTAMTLRDPTSFLADLDWLYTYKA
ncbi:MAG: FAD-dependent monooxygenase [Ahrensia sp.]